MEYVKLMQAEQKPLETLHEKKVNLESDISNTEEQKEYELSDLRKKMSTC